MSTPYVGEIRLFAGNFAPQGWAFCDGSIMSIAENTTLFQLIGTTYGGDGQNTFALPDLRGRVPVHQGNGFTIGQLGGEESVTLTANQLPAHTHAINASTAAATPAAGITGLLASVSGSNLYGPAPAFVPMAAAAVSAAGGNQAHDNMAPFQAISFIISLFGVFPSQA